MADQIVASASNFVLVLVVARESSRGGFGQFSLVLGSYLLFVVVVRAFSAEPLLVLFPRASGTSERRAAGAACGVMLWLGGGAGAFVVVAGLALGGGIGHLLVVVGLALPGLVLQDGVRFVLINRGNSGAALVNDLLYFLLQSFGFAICLGTQHTSPLALSGCWAVCGNVACVVILIQSRVLPHISRSALWLRETRQYGARFGLEAVASQGGPQLVIFILSGLRGVAAGGAIRAAETLFKPAAVLTGGARTALVPELAVKRAEPGAVVDDAKRLAAALASICVAAGLPLLLLSDHVGTLLLGASWATARPLFPALLLAHVAAVVGVAALIGLRALADPRRSLRAQLIGACLQLAGGTVGALWAGARGSVDGLAVACVVASFWWWCALRASAAACVRPYEVQPGQHRPVPAR